MGIGRILLLIFSGLIFSLSFSADLIRCSTVEVFQKNAARHPDAILHKQQLESDLARWIAGSAGNRLFGAVITIPVVVHVLYNTSEENISDAQIFSQISALNKDFRNLNADKLPSSHPFFSLAGDAGIEFCLAGVDPDGNVTNGITRTNTSETSFPDNDDMKFTTSGGIDAWNPEKYLNIWVCNLEGDLLGYAQFPSDFNDFPETDGVVIGYKYFGNTGTVEPPYNMGRTTVHEVGHWLNLEHIWGDDQGEFNECSGSDKVDDTPNQQIETYTPPFFNNEAATDICTTVAPGYMYQNYMDYTDDAYMVMFTQKQVTRMLAVLNTVRTGLLSSNICSGTTNISNQLPGKLSVYPNPIMNYLTIDGLPQTKSRFFTIDIINMLGETVQSLLFPAGSAMIEVQGLKTGTYVMSIYNEEFSATQKISVIR